MKSACNKQQGLRDLPARLNYERFCVKCEDPSAHPVYT